MEAITVKQLIDSIGNLRIQLFDADSGILLADGRKASKKNQDLSQPSRRVYRLQAGTC